MAKVNIDLRVTGSITIQQGHNNTAAQDRQETAQGHDATERWPARKRAARAMADVMRTVGYEGRATRMSGCGDWLQAAECPNGDHAHMRLAQFCRDRMCPICTVGRARKLGREMIAEMAAIGKRAPGVSYILLTLTTPNVRGYALKGEVRRLLKGWMEMARRQPVKGRTLGWVRRLELTIDTHMFAMDYASGKPIERIPREPNDNYGTHHVHLHVMLAVPSDYYVRGMVTQREYQRAWADALGHDLRADGPLIVDVRKADDGGVNEIAKYISKPLDYLSLPAALRDGAVHDVAEALRGARTVSWGGIWREVRAALGHTDEATETDTDPDQCPVCGADLQEIVYRWTGSDYMRTDKDGNILLHHTAQGDWIVL